MEVDIDLAYQLEIFSSDRTNREMFVAIVKIKLVIYWLNIFTG